MQTAEKVSTREYYKGLVKILDILYVKANLEQVDNNATQMNNEERTQLPRLLQYFEDQSDVTLGDWYAEPVNLELNPDSKLFNCKYYLVPRIDKEKFCKEIQHLVKIEVLTPQQPRQ